MRSSVSTIAILVCLGGSLFGLAAACSDDTPTDETPNGALTLFLKKMKHHDRKGAYDLLAKSSREALQKRAAAATKQAGRELEPSEMIAVKRFVLHWEIDRMEPAIKGSRATVTVHGKEASQKADVQLQKQDGRWRIILPLSN